MRMETVHTENGDDRPEHMEKQKKLPWIGEVETEASGRQQTSKHDDNTIYNNEQDQWFPNFFSGTTNEIKTIFQTPYTV